MVTQSWTARPDAGDGSSAGQPGGWNDDGRWADGPAPPAYRAPAPPPLPAYQGRSDNEPDYWDGIAVDRTDGGIALGRAERTGRDGWPSQRGVHHGDLPPPPPPGERDHWDGRDGAAPATAVGGPGYRAGAYEPYPERAMADARRPLPAEPPPARPPQRSWQPRQAPEWEPAEPDDPTGPPPPEPPLDDAMPDRPTTTRRAHRAAPDESRRADRAERSRRQSRPAGRDPSPADSALDPVSATNVNLLAGASPRERQRMLRSGRASEPAERMPTPAAGARDALAGDAGSGPDDMPPPRTPVPKPERQPIATTVKYLLLMIIFYGGTSIGRALA